MISLDRRISEAAFAAHGKRPWVDRLAIFCARELVGLEALAVLVVFGRLIASLSVRPLMIADILRFVPMVLLTVFAAWGLVVIVELLVGRPRPFIAFSKKPLDHFWTPTPSFPSSHAAIASGLAFLTLFVGPPVVPLVFFLIAAIIASARVYVGVHYVSDVIVGFAFGGAAVWVMAGIFVLFPTLAP